MTGLKYVIRVQFIGAVTALGERSCFGRCRPWRGIISGAMALKYIIQGTRIIVKGTKMKRNVFIIAPILLFIVIILTGCGARRIVIHDISMSPTFILYENAVCMTHSYSKEKIPEAFVSEVIVCKIGLEGDKRTVIKRVIGLPGEKVSFKNDKVYINGNELKEDYIDIRTKPENKDEFELKDDEVFVLGDNRTHSYDSRFVGPIKFKSIIGSVRR